MTNGFRRLPSILSRTRIVPFPESMTPIAMTSINGHSTRISRMLNNRSNVRFRKRQKVLFSLFFCETLPPASPFDVSEKGKGPGNCSADQIEYLIFLFSQREIMSGVI